MTQIHPDYTPTQSTAERDDHEQARRALEEEVGRLRYENAALREVLAAAVECWDDPKYKHFMTPTIDMARALLAKYEGDHQ